MMTKRKNKVEEEEITWTRLGPIVCCASAHGNQHHVQMLILTPIIRI